MPSRLEHRIRPGKRLPHSTNAIQALAARHTMVAGQIAHNLFEVAAKGRLRAGHHEAEDGYGAFGALVQLAADAADGARGDGAAGRRDGPAPPRAPSEIVTS
jgi:hypothetical protein